jgi:hypothetical protein
MIFLPPSLLPSLSICLPRHLLLPVREKEKEEDGSPLEH